MNVDFVRQNPMLVTDIGKLEFGAVFFPVKDVGRGNHTPPLCGCEGKELFSKLSPTAYFFHQRKK